MEGMPPIFSSKASVSMEECAAVSGDTPSWSLLNWSTSDEIVASLVAHAEACKALVLGARAEVIGRPYVDGLAPAGEERVREVIRNIRAEFDLTTGLAGCASVYELGPARRVKAD